MEKGSPGLCTGSKPHSYTDTFSLSGLFSPNVKEAIDMIPDKIKLKANNINKP